MRIAIITGEYPPLEGGVGAFTRQLAQALRAQQHQVHILTTTTDAGEPPRDAGVKVEARIGGWGVTALPAVRRWLRDVAPDVVNLQYEAAAYGLHGAVTLLPHVLGGALPLVVTYHDLLPPYLFPKAGPLREWSVRTLARHASGAIVTNADDHAAFQTLAPQTPLRRIPIGSNIAPHPPPAYCAADWRAAHGFSATDYLVGFFGFMNRNKGLEVLVDAVAYLRDAGIPVRLLFIGGRTGSSDASNRAYADEIDHRIKECALGERVYRTGYADPAAVSAALLSCDVCALPYREGASLRHGTLHAALAHGCTIVTTAPGVSTPELQDGVNVRLVPAEEPAALANTLQGLWANPQQRAHLGQAARTLSRQFSWEHIAEQTAAFFRDVR